MEYEAALKVLRDRERMIALAWQARLAEARDPDEVLNLANQFLSTWLPSEIAALPNDCHPRGFACLDDIAFYAFRLVREQCSGREGTVELHRMAIFFAGASQRIAQLHGSAQTEVDLRSANVAVLFLDSQPE